MRILLCITLALLSAVPASGASLSQPQDFGAATWGNAVSPDGAFFVGVSDPYAVNSQAVIWDGNGTISALGFLPGDVGSRATAVSNGGSVVVGSSHSGGWLTTAVRWDNGVISALSKLPGGTMAEAFDVSGDGSIIVGYSRYGSYQAQAVRWDGNNIITPLGFLPGGDESGAEGISTDGSVIIGQSNDSFGNRFAVKWNSMNTITSLGALPGGTTSYAHGVNANGSVIVGESNQTNGENQAVRWDNGIISALPYLAGGDHYSYAMATNSSGAVIVGAAGDPNGNVIAARWTASGAESLADVLAAEGVDLTGWTLDDADGVSADGTIITGRAQGYSTAFIANTATGGLTTIQNLVTSIVSTIVTPLQAVSVGTSNLSQGLFVARNLSNIAVPLFPAATRVTHSSANMESKEDKNANEEVASFAFMAPAAGGKASRLSLYSVGSLGTGQNNESGNNNEGGTIGLNVAVGDASNIGVGIVRSTQNNRLAFDGNSKMEALGLSTVAAYVSPSSGVRIYGSAYVSTLGSETKRNYINGAGVATSRGSTDGIAYGTALRGGYAIPISNSTDIEPYIEGRWAKSTLDGFMERDGPFRSYFSGQRGQDVTSRIGAELKHRVSARLETTARADWAHRLDAGVSRFTATTFGIVQGVGSTPGDRDWAEGAIGLKWNASEQFHLSTEIEGRTGNVDIPTASLFVGVGIQF